MIDKQFRCLCEYDCRHTAAGSISIVTRALALFGIKLTCAKFYFYDTDVLIFRDFYTISKRVYRHYDTRQDLLNNDFSGQDVTPIIDALRECAREGAAAPRRAPAGVLSRVVGRESVGDSVNKGKVSEKGLESPSMPAA